MLTMALALAPSLRAASAEAGIPPSGQPCAFVRIQSLPITLAERSKAAINPRQVTLPDQQHAFYLNSTVIDGPSILTPSISFRSGRTSLSVMPG